MVRRVRDAGHETGCHGLYHETLGDPLFPLPNNWPILPSEVEGRLREATRIVREASGVRPVSFRCPRLWGSTHVLNVAGEAGLRDRCLVPPVLLTGSRLCRITRRRRTGRGRAGCGSWKSPISATSA